MVPEARAAFRHVLCFRSPTQGPLLAQVHCRHSIQASAGVGRKQEQEHGWNCPVRAARIRLSGTGDFACVPRAARSTSVEGEPVRFVPDMLL